METDYFCTKKRSPVSSFIAVASPLYQGIIKQIKGVRILILRAMTEQIPTGKGHYIIIHFDERDMRMKCMKNTPNDTSNIRRVKRECPSYALAIWKQDKRLRLRQEDVIFEPFIPFGCSLVCLDWLQLLLPGTFL
ncbi:hypothetical protein OROMI_002368 [Orobanche minor]